MTEIKKELTIREHIVSIQNELFSYGDILEPVVSATKSVELAALYSRVVRLLCEKEIIYKKKLEEIHISNPDKSAQYAKIRAEATSEFAEWRETDANLKAIQEMNRSLNRFQKASSEDYWNNK